MGGSGGLDAHRPYDARPGGFLYLHLRVIDARLIWRGVNAPTFPLCLAGLTGFQVLGFGVGEILYLAAVAILWYLVGRFIDRRAGLEVPTSRGIKALKIVSYFLLMAWGLFLLFGSLWAIRAELTFDRAHFFRINILTEALFMAWSLILLIFAGRRLAGGFAASPPGAPSLVEQGHA
jgi:hypothetical protein